MDSPLLSPGGDAIDSSAISVHPHPLIALDLHPTQQQQHSTTAATPLPSSNHTKNSHTVASVYIDESTDDLVVFTTSGDIFIYRLGLYEHVNTRGASGGSGDTWPGDVIHVATGNPIPAQIAKCCPLPNASQSSFMVAVAHSEECITFYMPKPSSADGGNVSHNKGAAAAKRPAEPNNHQPVTKPFATYMCAPKNLRFRNRFYPIRTFYWVASRFGQPMHQPSSVSSTSVETPVPAVAAAAVGAPHVQQPLALNTRAGCQYKKYLVILTQISIELAAVTEELYGAESAHVTLLTRISTRVDYWSYLSSWRCAVLINEAKPLIVKPFLVERQTVLTTMPQCTLDDAPSNVDAFVSPFSTSHMDAPRMQQQVVPITLYGSLMIAHVTPSRDVMLYRYHSTSASTSTLGVAAPGAASMGGGSDMLLSAPVMSGVSTSHSSVDGTGLTASGASTGWWERFLLLEVHGMDRKMVELDVLKLQVVDNMLLVHLSHAQRTTFFDIALMHVSNSNNGAVTPFSNHSGEGGVEGMSSFASGSTPTPQLSFASNNSARVFFDPMMGPNSDAVTPRTSPRNGGGAGGSPKEGSNSSSWISRLWSAGGSSSSSQANNASQGGVGSSRHPIRVMRSPPPFHMERQGDVDLYACEVHNGNLPMVLDRVHGEVRVVITNTTTLGAQIADVPQRVHFYLHRRRCQPSAVPHLLRSLIMDQEPLPSIAQSLDAVCTYNVRQAHRRRGTGGGGGTMVGPNLPSSKSTTAVTRTFRSQQRHNTNPCYPIVVDQVPIRCGSMPSALGFIRPAAQWQLITVHDVWGSIFQRLLKRMVSVAPQQQMDAFIIKFANAQWEDGQSTASLLRPSVDQASLFSRVFGPLSQQLASSDFSEVPFPLSTPPGGESHEGASPSPPRNGHDDEGNRNRYNESVCFSHYLLNTLLEYTRSLIQHGESLSDSVQRCVIYLFLQGSKSPDFFRLHQLLMYRAIDDQIPTALQLITLEHRYPPAFQMGLDMLARLSASNEMVQVFLAKQRPLMAAKHIVTGNGAVGATAQDTMHAVRDVLFCAALMHDEERKKLSLACYEDAFPSAGTSASRRNNRGAPAEGTTTASPSPPHTINDEEIQVTNGTLELTSCGAQYFTIYELLRLHVPKLLEERSLARFAQRYRDICGGRCV